MILVLNPLQEKVRDPVEPKLLIDPKTETFIDNKEADKLLTREYRKGFEVPEQGKA